MPLNQRHVSKQYASQCGGCSGCYSGKMCSANSNSKDLYPLRTIFVNLISTFAGIVPLIVLPIWKTISSGSDHILEVFMAPDIIFVGVALWIAYLSSVVTVGVVLKPAHVMINQLGIILGVVMFTIETIAEYNGYLQTYDVPIMVFNIAFCVAELVSTTCATIVEQFEKRRR